MKIGSVQLDNMTILAPLAGITNLPFRMLARQAGCALVYSEMVSSYGLVYNSSKTWELLQSRPQEKPLSVQLFGADPSIMAEAATMVEDSGADILDINLGCPVKKVLKSGAGVALMNSAAKVEALLQAVRRVLKIPLTIKIRTGWDPSGSQALHIAEIAQSCGVDAIALHPRTAAQGFKGKADWSLIATLKKRVSIPVIGNGDIQTPQDAVRMKIETGCDGLMIGRAAIGKPWIFSQVSALLQGNEIDPPDIECRFEIMTGYLKACMELFGEQRACRVMRGHLGWFVKGLRHSSRFREAVKQIRSEDEALALINAYRENLQKLKKI